ncbi:MAG: hypothetical protein ACREQQ_18005 [Candidatus Binatia bacterium]
MRIALLPRVIIPGTTLVRQAFPALQDEDVIKPAAIAEAFWYLAHQDPSAWSHELDLRPFKEKF